MATSTTPSGRPRVTPRRLALLFFLIALPTLILLFVVGVAVERNTHSAVTPAREIVLMAQNGKFNGNNPPMELKVGETVALTVANQDSSESYDFRISKLNVRTGYLAPGASERIVFSPARAGLFVYSCTLHPGTMEGDVLVRDR